MTMTCAHCKKATDDLKRVDCPEGTTLCTKCFDEIVWKCTGCDRLIAYPDVEGGQVPGFTPLELEIWCQECCDELVGNCDKCGGVELVDDLTSSEDGLLCERCIKGHSPAERDDSPPLTKKNWKTTVREAIRALPADLQASIGVSHPGENIMRIAVAGEPVGCDSDSSDETAITSIQIGYSDSVSQLDADEEEEFDGFSLQTMDHDGPILTLEGESSGLVQRYRIGFVTTGTFVGEVQLLILEELFSGGGMSLVDKDLKGRFIDKNGTQILPWQ